MSVVGDGPIEQQRVVVGNKEGYMRFVLQHVGLHTRAFFITYIRVLADAILQAARIKFTKTEYISCPGCGRTLYNLQETIARIKAATKDLVGLKIGIMGCIVNGPGEMADADYGYVGAGRGKISLYRAKECVEKNIPEAESVDKLLELIRSDRK